MLLEHPETLLQPIAGTESGSHTFLTIRDRELVYFARNLLEQKSWDVCREGLRSVTLPTLPLADGWDLLQQTYDSPGHTYIYTGVTLNTEKQRGMVERLAISSKTTRDPSRPTRSNCVEFFKINLNYNITTYHVLYRHDP